MSPTLQVIERKPCPTNLTDAQWALIKPFVRASQCGPQQVLHSRREVVNAIFYIYIYSLYINHTGGEERPCILRVKGTGRL